MSSPTHIPASGSFPKRSILLHWVMAVLIIATLIIGLSIAHHSTIHYAGLFTLHRTLGFIILALVLLRLANNVTTKHNPSLPATMPIWAKYAAHISHGLLYGFMLALPLVGWAMLSAGGYPITLWGGCHIPPLIGYNATLWAQLRSLHSCLAYGLAFLIMEHITAALFHGFIRRDGVLKSMLYRR